LFKVFVIADEEELVKRLSAELDSRGFLCSFNSDGRKALESVGGRAFDLVLVAIDGTAHSSEIAHLACTIKQEGNLPVIALLSREALHRLDSGLSVDDFVVEPWAATEVAARARRVLGATKNAASKELIKCGDLTIDLAKYEVFVNGRQVDLTFKEYELLRFLASNRGRVFTRDALLNKVWGYDYFGGDRTVDVHIRRLRSKIEDPAHTFIETVRNIGYRFIEES
jgi:two-component system alkaline phosphatase synthesis response regulator PhoP